MKAQLLGGENGFQGHQANTSRPDHAATAEGPTNALDLLVRLQQEVEVLKLQLGAASSAQHSLLLNNNALQEQQRRICSEFELLMQQNKQYREQLDAVNKDEVAAGLSLKHLQAEVSAVSAAMSSVSLQHNDNLPARSALFKRDPNQVHVVNKQLVSGSIFSIEYYQPPSAQAGPCQLYTDLAGGGSLAKAQAALMAGKGCGYRVMKRLGKGGQCEVGWQVAKDNQKSLSHCPCARQLAGTRASRQPA